jgi:hypothetical protein
MPGQILPAQLSNEIVQVVIELPVVTDVAARARPAMASHIGRNDQEVVGRQPFGDSCPSNGRLSRE